MNMRSPFAEPVAFATAVLLSAIISPTKLRAQPIIVVQPQSQAVPDGEDVLFTVSATGATPLSFQWRFNGVNLLGATSSNLYFASVHSNRVGNYSVRVTDIAGATFSSNASLTLLPAPLCVTVPSGVISWWPADGSLKDVIGTNDAVDVQVPPLPPGPLYVTGKVGLGFHPPVAVPNSPSLNFGSNADFSIEAWIQAPTNNIGIQFAQTNFTIVEKVFLTLPFPPLPPSRNGYAFELDNGRLACRLAPAPTNPLNSATFISTGPDLRDGRFHHVALTLRRSATNGGNLYVDGQDVLTFNPTGITGVLSNSTPMSIGSSSRIQTVPSSVIDELAIYNRALTAAEILAIRQAGSAGKCKLPPVFTVQPASQRVTESSNFTFTATATGTGSLRYQWRFSGTNLPGATNTSLTLTNVQIKNAGPYSVRVTNAFGAAISSNAVLTINRIPVALCTNVVASADANCLASASVDAGSFDLDGDSLALTQSPPGPYPLGTNLVTLTVTDSLGAYSSCSALVIVVDTTPPVLACPADITVEFINETGATVYFTPRATDNCTPMVSVTCTPASGSTFGIGATPVHCTATDDAGNSAGCAFQVTVLGAQGVISNVLVGLTGLRGESSPAEAERLDQAITWLGHSLDPSLWLDQIHLEATRGGQAFNEDKAAVQDLRGLIADDSSLTFAAVLQDFINRIVKADRLLAMVATHDAAAASGDPKPLARALEEVAKGDEELAGGQYEAAIAHYRNAWKHAFELTNARKSQSHPRAKPARI